MNTAMNSFGATGTAVLDETATTSYPMGTGHNQQAGSTSARATSMQSAAEQPSGTFSITSFVLGIVSIIAGWTFVAPIVGLVFGVIALRRKSAERTLAIWGVCLNGAILAFSALLAAGVIAVTVAGIFGGLAWGTWTY